MSLAYEVSGVEYATRLTFPPTEATCCCRRWTLSDELEDPPQPANPATTVTNATVSDRTLTRFKLPSYPIDELDFTVGWIHGSVNSQPSNGRRRARSCWFKCEAPPGHARLAPGCNLRSTSTSRRKDFGTFSTAAPSRARARPGIWRPRSGSPSRICSPTWARVCARRQRCSRPRPSGWPIPTRRLQTTLRRSPCPQPGRLNRRL